MAGFQAHNKIGSSLSHFIQLAVEEVMKLLRPIHRSQHPDRNGLKAALHVLRF
jgi:hypothetical protein